MFDVKCQFWWLLGWFLALGESTKNTQFIGLNGWSLCSVPWTSPKHSKTLRWPEEYIKVELKYDFSYHLLCVFTPSIWNPSSNPVRWISTIAWVMLVTPMHRHCLDLQATNLEGLSRRAGIVTGSSWLLRWCPPSYVCWFINHWKSNEINWFHFIEDPLLKQFHIKEDPKIVLGGPTLISIQHYRYIYHKP